MMSSRQTAKFGSDMLKLVDHDWLPWMIHVIRYVPSSMECSFVNCMCLLCDSLLHREPACMLVLACYNCTIATMFAETSVGWMRMGM